MKVTSLGEILESFIKENSWSESSPRPLMASPVIIALQVNELFSCIELNTLKVSFTQPYLKYLSIRVVPMQTVTLKSFLCR